MNGTLYIGVTNDLLRRVYEHKHWRHAGFTRRYDVNRLVYFEEYDDPYEAIMREKRLKKWNRKWKLRLIQESNPYWRDLYYIHGGKEFDDEYHPDLYEDSLLDSRPGRE